MVVKVPYRRSIKTGNLSTFAFSGAEQSACTKLLPSDNTGAARIRAHWVGGA